MQLAEEQQVAQRKVINALMEYLKSLEKTGTYNYQFILGTTFGGNILYANEGLDISDIVVKGLNEEYAKTKEKK
jgi:outer membrane protein